MLLARLAIADAHQGGGLGAGLLADAVRRIAFADEHVTVPLFVVDAIDDTAASFYERHGFQRMPAGGAPYTSDAATVGSANGASACT